MTTSPPPAGLKKLVPMTRSKSVMNCEPAMNGVPNTTSAEVVAFAHTSSGMRQTVMPGARMVKIVTRKLIAVMIELAPTNWMPTSKSVWPVPPCDASGV